MDGMQSSFEVRLKTFTLRGQDTPPSGEGIYGVPLTVYVRALICNRQLFKRAGVSLPVTWSDLLAASTKLRKLGVIPIAGGMDGNFPGFPIISEWSYLDSFNLFETYYGRYPYTGDLWQRQFAVYEEMRRYGVTSYEACTMNRSAAERYFLSGRCAVIMDGPWFATIQRTIAPSLDDWVVIGPPIDKHAPFLPRYPGGVAEGAVINSRSKNKQAAAKFLRWLTQASQQSRLANAMDSLPASVEASSSPRLNSHLRAFTPYVNYVATEIRYREKPSVLATLYGGARDIIRGRTTSSQVLSAAQRGKR